MKFILSGHKIQYYFQFHVKRQLRVFPFFEIQSQHNTFIMTHIWVKCILNSSILRHINKKPTFEHNLLLPLIFPTEMVSCTVQKKKKKKKYISWARRPNLKNSLVSLFHMLFAEWSITDSHPYSTVYLHGSYGMQNGRIWPNQQTMQTCSFVSRRPLHF